MKIKTESMGDVEIIDVCWWCVRNFNEVYGKISPNTCIGVVKINNGYEEKSYIGLGKGLDEEEDIKLILECGVPFYGEVR